MVKPGPNDTKVSLLIAGEELSELQRMTWMMSEAFGLDRRIENYGGQRRIGLYQWDLDCLLAVVDCALKDSNENPDKAASGYRALSQLSDRLRDEYRRAFGD